jgi:D-arabinose 5-phosphate isomerase GutQ
VIVALSYSGETEKLLRLLETIKRLGASLDRDHRRRASTLGRAATSRSIARVRRSVPDEPGADGQHDCAHWRSATRWP